MEKRQAGFEKRYSGSGNASAFVVFQGYIVSMGKMSVINSPTAGMYVVEWKDNAIPQGAKLGTYVTVMGKLITCNLGAFFKIVDARALKPETLRKFKSFLLDYLKD